MVNGKIPTTDLLVVSDIPKSNFQLISDYSPEHSKQTLLCCFTGTNGYVLVYENGAGYVFTVVTGNSVVSFVEEEVAQEYEWVLADVAERMW